MFQAQFLPYFSSGLRRVAHPSVERTNENIIELQARNWNKTLCAYILTDPKVDLAEMLKTIKGNCVLATTIDDERKVFSKIFSSNENVLLSILSETMQRCSFSFDF